MIPKKAIKKVKNEIHLEIAAGSLIAYGVFPQTKEGIELAKETAASKDTWVAPSDLPEYYDDIDSDLLMGKENDAILAIRKHLKDFYGISSAGTESAEDTRVVEGETQIYTPADKFVDDGKEFADKIVTDLDDALEETSNQIMDDIDAIIEADKKKYEDFKKQLNRKVDHPKLYPELQHIKTRYMWGQYGLYDIEFKSDIDRAIYFLGKLGIDKEQTPDKIAVSEWLLKVTGLSFREDYKQIKEYRKRILELIHQLLKLHSEDDDIIVPPVYDGYYQDPDEDEEEDEEEIADEEYDDLYGSNLDDLLNDIRVEEEPADQEKEVESQAETATQVLVEAEEAREEAIDESVLDDLPDEVRQSLVDLINKRKGKPKTQPEKKPSNYVSNRKIFNFLTNNLLKIQGQLDAVNDNIIRQNELLQANLQVSSGIYENIEIQNTILLSKLDQILQAVGGQSEAAKKFAEDEEKRLAEESLEASRDIAGVETATSTIGGKGAGGNSLLRRLTKFFGKRLAKKLWTKLVPRRLRARGRLARRGVTKVKSLPKRLAQSLGAKLAPKIFKKPAQVAVKNVAPRAAVKGFEHIALPGVTKALKTADAPVAKAITGTDNILARALRSSAVQKALVKVLGKEGAEKLSVKVAAKLIPGVSTAYGLGEGLARIAMGDVKGGFLSFGSAIPGAGYAFAAVDILRDINIDAYTKHIESNLPAPSNENFAAFFTEALGVTPDQYELGGTTGSQTVMLHGTELLIPPAATGVSSAQSADPIGGTLLAASAQYINKLGPVGAPIAPMFEQVAAPLTKVYDVPSTLVQTNVGGSLPSLQSTLSKIKEKRKVTPEEELSAMEKDLLEEQDPQSFADKLLKMIDPEGRFQELLQQINNRTSPPGGPGGEVGVDPFVLLGGSQDPGQAGIDFTLKGTQNRAVLAGEVVEIGHQYNPNSTGGDGRKGSGYGHYVVIRSINPIDGSQVDMLYAHFPKGEIKVKQGDRVSVGQDLGRMATAEDYANPVTRKEVGSGTGPHTSLDFFQAGTQKAHTGARALGDYILKELRKGPEGAIEKARQQAYQQQQTQKPQQPTDDLDHVKPDDQNKIPDTVSDNTFKNVSDTPVAEKIYQRDELNNNMRPPTQRQPAQSKYYLKQGGDNKTDTQIIMIPASSTAGKAIEKNAAVEGQRFVYDANYNVFKTQNEISSTERANLLRRLGLN